MLSGNDEQIVPIAANCFGLDTLFENSEYPFLSIVYGILYFEQLRNLRISGHYSKEQNPRFNLDVSLGNEIFKIFPCDATAAFFQQLFASPVELVIHKSDKRFTPETIGKILVIAHSKHFYALGNEEFQIGKHKTNKAVWALTEIYIKDVNTKRKFKNAIEGGKFKNSKVEIGANEANFLDNYIPIMTYLFDAFKENIDAEQLGYPPHMVEKILLTYLWERYRGNRLELRPYFDILATAGMIDKDMVSEIFKSEKSTYTKEDFLSGNGCTALESQVLKKFGFKYFQDVFPPVVPFGMCKFTLDNGKIDFYSDCGDATLRNLFMMFLYNPETGCFDVSRLYKLKEYGFDIDPKLIEYFEVYCKTPLHATIPAVLYRWALVVNRLNKPNDKYKVQYVSPAPEDLEAKGKEEYVDGYYGINTGFKNILMVIIKLFGGPRKKDGTRFFSMNMRTRLDCVKNLNKICYLMSETDLEAGYPVNDTMRLESYWSVRLVDYTSAVNFDVTQLLEPTPNDGWTGLTLVFSINNNNINEYRLNLYTKVFEWHIDARHYDFNRIDLPDRIDTSKVMTIEAIYSLRMDSAKEKIRCIDCILNYLKATKSKAFEYLLANWLAKEGTHFAGWKNRKLNYKLVEVLLRYKTVDEILSYGIPELHDSLVWQLVQRYNFEEARSVLVRDIRYVNREVIPDSFTFETAARALAQSLRFCNDTQLLGLRDIDANGYCLSVSGSTLFHLVAFAANENLSTSISKLGVDINQPDSAGRTPLQLAIFTMSPVTVLNLLTQNAELSTLGDWNEILDDMMRRIMEMVTKVKNPTDPYVSASETITNEKKKHEITSKMQFIEDIGNSNLFAAEEIERILYDFKKNYFAACKHQSLLGRVEEDVLSKLTEMLRTKHFEKSLSPHGYSPNNKSLVKPKRQRHIRNFRGLNCPFEYSKYSHLTPLYGVLNKNIINIFLKYNYVGKDPVGDLLDFVFNSDSEILATFLTPRMIGMIFVVCHQDGFYENGSANDLLKVLTSGMKLYDVTIKELSHISQLLFNAFRDTKAYPNHVVENILLTYMWDNYHQDKASFKPYYDVLSEAGMIDTVKANEIVWIGSGSEYTEEDYKRNNGLTILEIQMLGKSEARSVYEFFPDIIQSKDDGCVETAIHNMLLMFLYNKREDRVDIIKLFSLLYSGFNVDSDLMTYLMKVCFDRKYVYTKKGREEWANLLCNLNKPDERFKVKYHTVNGKLCIAPGIKNMLRAIGKLLGVTDDFDMQMKDKFTCLININLLCYYFSGDGLKTWNPNTNKNYWTVSMTGYGIQEDQDICGLLEPIAENEDWSGVSFLFSNGSMAKHRQNVFELHAEDDLIEVNKSAVHFFFNFNYHIDLVNEMFQFGMQGQDYSISSTFRIFHDMEIDLLDDRPLSLFKMLWLQQKESSSIAFKHIIESWLEPTGKYFAGWRHTKINISIVNILRKFYTVKEILALNIIAFNEALTLFAVLANNIMDLRQILRSDLKYFTEQVHLVDKTSFASMARALATIIENGDENNLITLLKAGANDYVMQVTGASVLHLIARSGNVVMLRAMLHISDDINVRDNEGRTPLHYAVTSRINCNNIVSCLLEHGADPNVIDNDGVTPLAITTELIKMEVTRLNMIPKLFLFRDKFCELPGVDSGVFELLIREGAKFNRKDVKFAELYYNKYFASDMRHRINDSRLSLKSLFTPKQASYTPSSARRNKKP